MRLRVASTQAALTPKTFSGPFRAFLEERAHRQAAGKNCLFFGDQHEASDFLYRDLLMDWQTRGVLNNLDTAWSRDQEAKTYVQDKMREHATEYGDMSEEEAAEYVKQLNTDHRYLRDVY